MNDNKLAALAAVCKTELELIKKGQPINLKITNDFEVHTPLKIQSSSDSKHRSSKVVSLEGKEIQGQGLVKTRNPESLQRQPMLKEPTMISSGINHPKTKVILIKKEEKEETSHQSSQITEKELSTYASRIHLNTFDFGTLNYNIVENDMCRLSSHTGLHVQRKTGHLTFRFNGDMAGLEKDLLIRAMLIRKNPTFSHFPINQICSKHEQETHSVLRKHVLQASLSTSNCWYEQTAERMSVCFWLGHEESNNGTNHTVQLKFLCNSSCHTTNTKDFNHPESSRDLYLILTLESIKDKTIIARRKIEVWPKAVVRDGELFKTERRKKKGGAAPKNISGVARRQKRTKEKMLENAIFRSIRNSQNVGMTKTQLCDKVLELWDKAM